MEHPTRLTAMLVVETHHGGWPSGYHMIRIIARRSPDFPVHIGLTAAWTPLADARRELHRAVARHDRLCEAGDEMRDWRVLLFTLWRADRIDIGGRLHRPNLAVELAVLDYPLSEKLLLHWQLTLEGDDRLLHHASGQFYYDVHIRALPASRRKKPRACPADAWPGWADTLLEELTWRAKHGLLVEGVHRQAQVLRDWAASLGFHPAGASQIAQIIAKPYRALGGRPRRPGPRRE